MYCYSIICTNGLLIPDVFINLVDGKDLSLVFHQKEQDIVLDRSKLYRFTVHGHFLGVIIHTQTAHLIQCIILDIQAAKLGITPQV